MKYNKTLQILVILCNTKILVIFKIVLLLYFLSLTKFLVLRSLLIYSLQLLLLLRVLKFIMKPLLFLLLCDIHIIVFFKVLGLTQLFLVGFLIFFFFQLFILLGFIFKYNELIWYLGKFILGGG